MDQPTIIGLGEILWDEFPDGRRPGGAPANVAFHANQVGARGLIASRVGTDSAGDELLEFLRSRELSTELVQRDPEHPTGRVSVELSDGQPTYVIHREKAWDYLEAEAGLLQAMSQAGAICFGTLAQRSPVSRSTIHACLAAAGEQTLVVYDVNLRQDFYEREWIEASLHAAEVLKLNTDELDVLAGLLGLDGKSPASFASSVRKEFDVQLVCLTRGSEGCLLINETETVDIPGEPVDVADAVGAGDAFLAGFVSALLHSQSLEVAGQYANRIGGLVASRPGAMPDISKEAAAMRTW